MSDEDQAMRVQFNPEDYFRDLALEFQSLKNRVRQLIGAAHWPTDGGWKESVLRATLRRYLPPSMSVGSGFILCPDGVSTQIDIIVYDDSGPVLFRDGDLVVVPPSVVRAVIEVKTKVESIGQFNEFIRKLDDVCTMVPRWRKQDGVFVGLFAYDSELSHETTFRGLSAENRAARPVNACALGENRFIRYWPDDPTTGIERDSYRNWHVYRMQGLAHGYFVHNVLDHIYPQAIRRHNDLWFPPQGKEVYVVEKIARASDVYSNNHWHQRQR